MIIKLNKNGAFPISYLKNYIDISSIMFYTIDIKNNKNIIIKFYDESLNLIKPYKEKKNGKENQKPKIRKTSRKVR